MKRKKSPLAVTSLLKITFKSKWREFLGSPVARTPSFHCKSLGSIPVRELRSHKQCGTTKKKIFFFLLKINNVSQEENRARKMLRMVPGMGRGWGRGRRQDSPTEAPPRLGPRPRPLVELPKLSQPASS